jgi:hypothetical protein
LANLVRQLTRVAQHQRIDLAFGRDQLVQSGQHKHLAPNDKKQEHNRHGGQEKRHTYRSLAHAGLGLANDIRPHQRLWNDLILHWTLNDQKQQKQRARSIGSFNSKRLLPPTTATNLVIIMVVVHIQTFGWAFIAAVSDGAHQFTLEQEIGEAQPAHMQKYGSAFKCV